MEYYSAVKKECIWVSSSEVDESRAYYIEWSKSEKQIIYLYIYIYIYGIYKNGIDESIFREGMEMQTENRLVDTVGKGESEANEESSTDICTPPCVK